MQQSGTGFLIFYMIFLKKPENRVVILEKCNNRCSYCGCKLTYNTLHVDHMIPKMRGKYQIPLSPHIVDCFENYWPCCQSCNSSKSSLSLDEWRENISSKVDRLLRTESSFQIALKFKQIKPTNKPVIFYFEKLNNG